MSPIHAGLRLQEMRRQELLATVARERRADGAEGMRHSRRMLVLPLPRGLASSIRRALNSIQSPASRRSAWPPRGHAGMTTSSSELA